MVMERRVPFLEQLLRRVFIIAGLLAMNCGEEKINSVVEVVLLSLIMKAMIFFLMEEIVAVSSRLMAMIDPKLSQPN